MERQNRELSESHQKEEMLLSEVWKTQERKNTHSIHVCHRSPYILALSLITDSRAPPQKIINAMKIHRLVSSGLIRPSFPMGVSVV